MKYYIFLLLLWPATISADIHVSLKQYIDNVEGHYKLPKNLLAAIINVESGGAIGAVNPNDGTKLQKLQGKIVKSVGLMQLQLATARHMGFRGKLKDLILPVVNIEYGARYLRQLLDTHHNNIAQALTCFNSGPASSSCINRQYTPYVGKVLNSLYANR